MTRARELAELAAAYDSGGLSNMRNRIINGAMVIDQRNAGASVAIVAGATFVTDRFVVTISQGSGHTAQRSTVAPAGFVNSLLVTVGTGASPTAAQVSRIFQAIEGFNIADLGWGTADAQTITLSFWVRSSLTGTFAGGLYNGASNRTRVFTYAISAANTWEQKTITIPGDTTGTWATNNTGGIYVNWDLGSGSDWQTTADTWTAGVDWATSGSVKLAATSGATFYITGVQLEKGSTATSFDYRPYGTELMLCQRYFTRYSNDGSGLAGIGSGFQISTTQSLAIVNFPVQMRSEPTAAISNLQISDRFTHDTDVTLDAIRAGYLSAEMTFTNASVGAQYRPCTLFVKNNTSGFLNLSAEL